MTTTINAAATTGLAISADGSGVMKLQSNGVTTNALAWVNLVGSTGAIRASYNVSSVTRNASGDFTLNFTTALADANYVFSGSGSGGNTSLFSATPADGVTPRTTTAFRFVTTYQNGTTAFDCAQTNGIIFGN